MKKCLDEKFTALLQFLSKPTPASTSEGFSKVGGAGGRNVEDKKVRVRNAPIKCTPCTGTFGKYDTDRGENAPHCRGRGHIVGGGATVYKYVQR